MSACNAAGVGVIADAVLNHMSGSAFGEPGDAAGSSEIDFSAYIQSDGMLIFNTV